MISSGKKQLDLGALFRGLQDGSLDEKYGIGGPMGFLPMLLGGMMGGKEAAAPTPAAPGAEAPEQSPFASLKSTPQWWQTWRAQNGGAPPVRGLLG